MKRKIKFRATTDLNTKRIILIFQKIFIIIIVGSKEINTTRIQEIKGVL